MQVWSYTTPASIRKSYKSLLRQEAFLIKIRRCSTLLSIDQGFLLNCRKNNVLCSNKRQCKSQYLVFRLSAWVNPLAKIKRRIFLCIYRTVYISNKAFKNSKQFVCYITINTAVKVCTVDIPASKKIAHKSPRRWSWSAKSPLTC